MFSVADPDLELSDGGAEGVGRGGGCFDCPAGFFSLDLRFLLFLPNTSGAAPGFQLNVHF